MKIGLDLVSIKRIELFINRFGERGLKRYLCDAEIALIKSPKTAAGFWAAKEAVSKALGTGIGSALSFHDITLSKSSLGAPQASLSPHAIAHFGPCHISLSITHDQGFAAAVALVECDKIVD